MRILSTIIVAALAMSLAGCVSYSRHEREDRVVEHRHAERSHHHGGYYRRGDRHDGHHHRGSHDDRHHPRGR